MTFHYLSSMVVVLFGAFFGSMASLFAGLSKQAGFNPFETLFFSGLLILSATISFDLLSNALKLFCRRQQNQILNQPQPAAQPPAYAAATLADILNNVPTVTTALIPTGPNNDNVNNNVNNNNNNAANNPPIPTLSTFWSKTHLNYIITLRSISPNAFSWLLTRGFTCTLVLISLYFISYHFGEDVMVVFDTVPVWALFFDTYLLSSDVAPAHYFLTILLIVGAVFIQQPPFLFDYSGTNNTKPSNSPNQSSLDSMDNDPSNNINNNNDSSDSNENNVISFETAGGLVLTLACAITQALSVASIKHFTDIETLYDPNNITIPTNAETITFAGIYSVCFNFIVFGIIGSLSFYKEFMADVLLYDNIGLTGCIYVLLASLTWLLMIFSVNYGVKKLNVNEVTLLATTHVVWGYLLNNAVNNKKPYQNDGVAVVGTILMTMALILAFGKSMWDRCSCVEPGRGMNHHNASYWINNNGHGGYGALGNGANGHVTVWNNVNGNDILDGHGAHWIGYDQRSVRSDGTRSEKSVESRTTILYSGEYA